MRTNRLTIIVKHLDKFLNIYNGKKLTPQLIRYIKLYIVSTYKEAKREAFASLQSKSEDKRI